MAQSWRRPSYISGLLFGLAVVVSCGWLVMSRPWAGQAEPASAQEPDSGSLGKPSRQSGSSNPARQSARDQFAADRDDVVFDGARTIGYLKDICKIGPRISGTDGMKKHPFEAH